MPDKSKVMAQTKTNILVLQVGRLGVGLTTPCRKRTYVEKTSKMPRMGSTNRRRPGYKGKDLIFGTWNIRTLFDWSTNILDISTTRIQAWHNSTTGNKVGG